MKPYSPANLICIIIFCLILFSTCKKNNGSAAFTGTWTSAGTKTFDDIILWTDAGKITDQSIILPYLQRHTNFFSIDKTPEPLSYSASFHFENNYVITDIDQSIDTVQYLEKNNNFAMLKFDLGTFTNFPTDNCQRLVDSLLAYPSTTICETLPPVNGVPGYHCIVPQYYPIEVNGNQLRLSGFAFHIRSGLKNSAGQITAACTESASNVFNTISTNLEQMLKPGDTIVTQKSYIALTRL